MKREFSPDTDLSIPSFFEGNEDFYFYEMHKDLTMKMNEMSINLAISHDIIWKDIVLAEETGFTYEFYDNIFPSEEKSLCGWIGNVSAIDDEDLISGSEVTGSNSAYDRSEIEESKTEATIENLLKSLGSEDITESTPMTEEWPKKGTTMPKLKRKVERRKLSLEQIKEKIESWEFLRMKKGITYKKAAEEIGIPKKSLDDYKNLLKIAFENKFNYERYKNDRIGVLRELRKIVQQLKKNKQSQNKALIAKYKEFILP